MDVKWLAVSTDISVGNIRRLDRNDKQSKHLCCREVSLTVDGTGHKKPPASYYYSKLFKEISILEPIKLP